MWKLHYSPSAQLLLLASPEKSQSEIIIGTSWTDTNNTASPEDARRERLRTPWPAFLRYRREGMKVASTNNNKSNSHQQ